MNRVLQVLGTVDLGGAESRVMDLYEHTDREKLQYDFLVTSGKKGYYEDKIRSLGGKVFFLPPFRVVNYFAYAKACRDFFRTHNDYIAVHGHMTSTASIYLPIAKKAGIPVTIAHVRSAGTDPGLKGIVTKILRKNLYKKCDVMIGCSDLAAESAFGKARVSAGQVLFMPNAIDSKEFIPDSDKRREIRSQYGVKEEDFLIGHVGRFHYAKNHEFLIDIFNEIASRCDNAKLMLVGDGNLRKDIENKVISLGLEDKVIFAGNHTPIAPYYMAFDYFLFPSRYEGLPGTVVEAQASGKRCLISDTITGQAKICELVSYMSLDDAPLKWAEYVLSDKENEAQIPDLSDSLYDVNNQIKIYDEIYGGK